MATAWVAPNVPHRVFTQHRREPDRRGESRPLQFVRQIGSGWLSEKPGWMSFVSFSPDGTMVASDDAAAPGDVCNTVLNY